jgi:hypothetical protein
MYHDGLSVINELKIGTEIRLVPEFDNPYDPEAVAIFCKDKKIGFIPKDKNSLVSLLIYFGYGDILEAKIAQVNHEQHPERQFRLVVKIKDNRDAAARKRQSDYEKQAQSLGGELFGD